MLVRQGGQPMTQEQQAADAAQREEADMQRQAMLAAIMQPSARERCAATFQIGSAFPNPCSSSSVQVADNKAIHCDSWGMPSHCKTAH